MSDSAAGGWGDRLVAVNNQSWLSRVTGSISSAAGARLPVPGVAALPGSQS